MIFAFDNKENKTSVLCSTVIKFKLQRMTNNQKKFA